ncbi:MAG: RNA 2'-phosphotransferase [Bradymonadia bacterium]
MSDLDARQMKRVSKFISLLLRHQPQLAGLSPDRAGWVPVDGLLEGMHRKGTSIDRALLDEIVRTDEKGRYSFTADGTRIRANQGHSIDVDLGYDTVEPPPVLYHGTSTRNLDAIKAQGLKRMNRHHVHLSAEQVTARTVGGRHGKPVVLHVDAARMHGEGWLFQVSENGVWLVDFVPAEYLSEG